MLKAVEIDPSEPTVTNPAPEIPLQLTGTD
jgi:hypothetical protein